MVEIQVEVGFDHRAERGDLEACVGQHGLDRVPRIWLCG
jgi:hypothetical protein